MPVVELHVLEGYNSKEKQRLGQALTDAVRFVVPATPELVTIMIHDMPTENYYRGRIQRRPAAARPDPELIIKDYLSAMETRDLEKANTLLAQGFTMSFPGTGPMTTLDALIQWSKPRYKFVTKTYCRGTLQGEYHDGSCFEAIRFIDRFEVIDGKITKQDVWNDMAEVRANT
jgi:phenylpyruvate tautomerase PptA (4-oxalocrotonate tautomerase family)/ketosteroid isomerase-like protein